MVKINSYALIDIIVVHFEVLSKHLDFIQNISRMIVEVL